MEGVKKISVLVGMVKVANLLSHSNEVMNLYLYYVLVSFYTDLHVNVCGSAHCCGCVIVDNSVAVAAYVYSSNFSVLPSYSLQCRICVKLLQHFLKELGLNVAKVIVTLVHEGAAYGVV